MVVQWLGVLMLAYSVASSQHASNSKGDVIHSSHHVKQLSEIGQTDNDDTLSLIKELLSRRGLEHRNHDSTVPKRVKITYRRRSTNSNKDNTETDNSKLDTGVKTKHEYLEHPLDSKEAELLPFLLEYLDKSDKGNSVKLLKDTRRSASSEYEKNREDRTENKNEKEGLEKSHQNRRGWSLVVVNNKKHKANGPDNDVISAIQYGNVHSGEGGSDVITGNGPYTRYQQKIVPYRGYGDYYGGGNKIMYHLEHNNEDSHDKENVGSRTVYQLEHNDKHSGHEESFGLKTFQKQKLDSSQVEEQVKKLCANAKTNLLDFWKVAAGYFGLDNKNLSDKQKMDLFLTILRSVDGTKQAKTLGLKPEESKLSPIVPVTENPADIYWSNDNKAEKQQYQEPPNTGGYEEKVVFKDQQEPNQKESGLYGLDSQDFSLVNEDAPVKPNSVFDVVSKDKQIFNKKEEDHSKEHSLDFNKSEESERGFDPTSEKEVSNEIEKTTLKPEFELDQQHDDRRTDDEDDALIKINNDSNVENAGNSKEYVAILNPKLGTDFGSSQIDNEDTENVSDEVTVGPYIYTHNDTLSSSESNAPVSKENVSSDDSYATPVTENNNDFLEQPKEITDSEDVSKELTESTQPDEDKTPSEEVANAHKDHEFEIFGLEDSEETSKVGKSNKLSLLLTLLKGLPKDKRARILLLLKALKAKHTDGNHVESVDDITDANNSAAELESLLKGLKGEPKDKLAEILLHFMAKKKAHPKLLVKYKVALKSNGQTEANNDLSDQSGSDDSDSKNNDSDEEKRPKLHLKWNVHLKPTNDLKGLLFQIISKFNQLGISDEALQEINSDLDKVLTENDDVSDCQSKVLNEKINEIKKGFQKLLKLRQEGDDRRSSENDQ